MKVLFLDDDKTRRDGFRERSIGHDVDLCETAEEAIRALQAKRYDLVSLDHDLGGKVFVDSDEPDTGYAVAKKLAAMPKDMFPGQVVIHSFNPIGAERMLKRLLNAGVNAMRAPYGTWSING